MNTYCYFEWIDIVRNVRLKGGESIVLVASSTATKNQTGESRSCLFDEDLKNENVSMNYRITREEKKKGEEEERDRESESIFVLYDI